MPHAAEMRSFSEIVAPVLGSNRAQKILGIFLRRGQGSATKLQDIALGESSGAVRVTEDMAAEVCERSAVVDEALRYMTYLYLEQANITLSDRALYIEDRNWKSESCTNIETRNFQRCLSLPDSAAALRRIVELKPPNRAIVELHKRREVGEREQRPETPLSLLMNSKDSVFTATTS